MVGIAFAVAGGKMPMKRVADMLNEPDKYERLSKTKLNHISYCAPPWGLYMTDVAYDPKGRALRLYIQFYLSNIKSECIVSFFVFFSF